MSALVASLQEAIYKRYRESEAALDKLADLAYHADGTDEGEIHDAKRLVREAIEVARCCRRLLKGRTPGEIHAAFGAPGDFGYDTPIGDALAKLYRGEP